MFDKIWVSTKCGFETGRFVLKPVTWDYIDWNFDRISMIILLKGYYCFSRNRVGFIAHTDNQLSL